MLEWEAAKLHRDGSKRDPERIYPPGLGQEVRRSSESANDVRIPWIIFVLHGIIVVFQPASHWILNPCNRYYYSNKCHFAIPVYVFGLWALFQLKRGRDMCQCVPRQGRVGLMCANIWTGLTLLVAFVLFCDACIGIHCESTGKATRSRQYPAAICRDLTFQKYKTEREVELETERNLGAVPKLNPDEVTLKTYQVRGYNVSTIVVQRSSSITNCYYAYSKRNYDTYRLIGLLIHSINLVLSLMLVGITGFELQRMLEYQASN